MYPVLLFCESGFLCVALAVVHSGLRDPPASLCVPPLSAHPVFLEVCVCVCGLYESPKINEDLGKGD